MKFIINRDVLLENLTNVSKALSTKNIIPILSGIKFDLLEDGLYLTATDNDITIQSFIKKEQISDITELGSVVIQGKYILEIIRKFPDPDIEIELVDKFKIWIHSPNTEYYINAFDPEDFPETNIDETKTPIILDNKNLKELVNKTIFSTSNDEARPILTGINIKIENNKIIFSATDSYRLSTYELEVNNKEQFDFIISSRNILELMKIVTEEGKIELHIFKNKILFIFNNILFQSKLINGNYPNVSSMIPTEFNLEVEVDINKLFDVIDRVSLLSADKEKNIVNLKTYGNKAVISSSSPEIGRAEEGLEIIKNNESEINISFNSKYMLDALKSYRSDKIKLYFISEIKPIVIKRDSQLNLILPIRTY